MFQDRGDTNMIIEIVRSSHPNTIKQAIESISKLMCRHVRHLNSDLACLFVGEDFDFLSKPMTALTNDELVRSLHAIAQLLDEYQLDKFTSFGQFRIHLKMESPDGKGGMITHVNSTFTTDRSIAIRFHHWVSLNYHDWTKALQSIRNGRYYENLVVSARVTVSHPSTGKRDGTKR